VTGTTGAGPVAGPPDGYAGRETGTQTRPQPGAAGNGGRNASPRGHGGRAAPRSQGGSGGDRPPGENRPPASKWRTIFFGLALFGIVGALAWALLGSRFLVVRSVRVTGTERVAVSAVIAAADVPDGTPLLRVDTGAVARRVEAIRDVASATVTKSWPDGLVIAVRERIPVFAVRMSSGYDLMDPTGVIVTWAAAKPAGLPEYETSLPGNALRGNADLAAAASVLSALPSWLSGSVTEVSAPETGQVTLRLSDNVTIVWGSDSRNQQKSQELRILMKQAPASYYDVSAEGTVVTK
jgi:cell division protein FtsQ